MCNQCQELMINGVRCHETGCPDAWRDIAKECEWCGQSFVAEFKAQPCCDDDCYHAWSGI